MSLERLKRMTEQSSIAAVAEKIGVSRTTLSLVVNGKYPAGLDKVLERFDRTYLDVNCPFAGRELTRADCNARSTAPRPFGGAAKTAWWEACQVCEHKMTSKTEG